MAEKLYSGNYAHLRRAAEIIENRGVIAFPFNGVYGLFGVKDDLAVAERIHQIKQRPLDKKLVLVTLPQMLHSSIDINKFYYPIDKIVQILETVHALGVITPASESVPGHLINKRGDSATVLTIWTEYWPLREVLGKLAEGGIGGLVGTSANKSRQGTHTVAESLWDEMHEELDAVVMASFDYLPERRKRSTSIIDLTFSDGTGYRPRLHRIGNLTQRELDKALVKAGLPVSLVDQDTIIVKPRREASSIKTSVA